MPTVYFLREQATRLGGGVFSCSVYNFILYNNTVGGTERNYDNSSIALSCGSDLALTEGNIQGNPQFVDPDGADFHLRITSPCVDAATNTYGLPVDFDGNRRPLDGNGDGIAGYDMGAYSTLTGLM